MARLRRAEELGGGAGHAEWVLSLDADEALSEALEAEIWG